ncbi:MAG: hypothetical protein M5R36_20375 [Deltaproteobacteria bacterium]|nr:hypothetical protein [Deltaproteobacteria bacterium]
MVEDSVIRRLGGAYEEQSVYIRDAGDGVRFYAAIWPWQARPDVLTVHLGIVDEAGGDGSNAAFRDLLATVAAAA